MKYLYERYVCTTQYTYKKINHHLKHKVNRVTPSLNTYTKQLFFLNGLENVCVLTWVSLTGKNLNIFPIYHIVFIFRFYFFIYGTFIQYVYFFKF